ncbi:MAG: EAL domain-containing protein [Marinomonas sp.]|jgi:sensor c-di-GMP phosphodiesterase-like protein|uniref:EAL domain-containing protein n=2 Tax=Oceanospirillaceae TaxID=135620 RepID=UPI0010550DD5|nr:EAL domain-containing protein [Marinomonas sp. KMM3893]
MHSAFQPTASSFFSLPKKMHWMALLSGLLGTVIAISVVHVVIIKHEREFLRGYSEAILNRGLQANKESRLSLKFAQQSQFEQCSPEDIEYLRESLWNYDFIHDIGRIKNGAIECTAGWGLLAEQKKLPHFSELTPDGYQFWKRLKDIPTEGITSNAIARRNSIAFVSHYVFKNLPHNPEFIAAVLTTKHSDYIYKTFGDLTKQQAIELLKKKEDPFFWLPVKGRQIQTQLCTQGSTVICTTATDSQLGIFGISNTYHAIIIVIGFLFGGILSLLLSFARLRKNSLGARLKQAIDKKLLHVQYQPKIQLQSGMIIGVEALARWNDEEYGYVSPDVFIALAEQNNQIKELTKLIVSKTLSDMRDYLVNNKAFFVSINLSIQDLTDSQFLLFIDDLVQQHGIRPEQLIFEITERSAADQDAMSNTTKQFVKKGYQVSLDDFGTGYSNLSWLSALEADEIKIDKMFTQAIGTDSINQNMLNGIFQLIENLKMHVVFEGIEEQREEDYILERSPNAIGQGWLYSRPVLAEEIGKLLISQPLKKTHA